MKKRSFVMLVGVFVLVGMARTVGAADVTCRPAVLDTGAVILLCKPAVWNGDLVVYAHGYVAPGAPLALPDDTIGGVPVAEIILGMGFAFATTSYRTNGLAVPVAVQDLADVTNAFTLWNQQSPGHVYLIGVSEGGLIATLAVEQHPELFNGTLACCGPVGDFRRQIDYIGDFLVLFNYFFPGVIPDATPRHIPDSVMSHWYDIFTPRVLAAITSNPDVTAQLLRVARAPFDPADPSTAGETVLGILWYDIFATNDAIARLGGQPYDNTERRYSGSDNDLLLNSQVQRISADAGAIAELETRYQTSGRLSRPVVALHTLGDPIIPYWHEPAYTLKVLLAGSGALYKTVHVIRYGHCNFTLDEALRAFALLILKATEL